MALTQFQFNTRPRFSHPYEVDKLIPCAGQGIIAIQCKDNDSNILELLEKINDTETRIIANTEREVLKILEGDCDTAVGVFAKIINENIELAAELFSVDGNKRYFIKESNIKKNHMLLAKKIAEELKNKSKGSYKR